jgi:hypothetical protein
MRVTLPMAPRPMKPHVASRTAEVEKNRAGLEEAEAARHTAEPICVLLIVLVVASADSYCSTALRIAKGRRFVVVVVVVGVRCGQCSPAIGSSRLAGRTPPIITRYEKYLRTILLYSARLLPSRAKFHVSEHERYLLQNSL